MQEQEVIFISENQGEGHHNGPHLRWSIEEGDQSGNAFRVKDHELPYFHGVLQHIQSVVELEYPVKETGP